MKYIIVIFSLLIGYTSQAQLIVNEVIFASNELELKNAGSSPISLISTFIQSTGNSMFITDATNLTCGGFTLQAGEKVVVPVSYPIVSSGGDFMIFQGGQTPTAYVQWGGVQGFATSAFAEGLWDDPMTFVPAAMADGSIILIDDDERKNPTGWLTIGESSPCEDNDQCEIANVSISSIECDDNGTSDDPTDDFFTFFLKVQGVNLPEELFLTSSIGALEPSVMYEYQLDGILISSYNFPSSSSNIFDFILTAENGECSYTTTFIAPSTCSPDCNMQNSQAIIIGCVDNGTAEDPSDDFIELVVKPFGFNLDDAYFVEFSFGNVEGPFINASPFTVISTEGFYAPGSGDFSVTIIDADNLDCTETIAVIDQENCSPNCVVNIDSLAVRCDDGGTPYDDTDDFYTLDLQASSSASASTMFQASIDPFLAVPQMLANDVLHSFSSAPGSTNVINAFSMTLIDPAYPTCIGITLHGFLEEGCLSECEIFPADIALDAAPLICLEPEDESIFTFDVINGIVMDTFLLLALNELEEIVFVSDKLSFDAREFDSGIYEFLVVHFIELSEFELGEGIDRLEGCFALSPYVNLEILFQENCTTALKELGNSFTIYPNPTANSFCIKSDLSISKISVFDVNGAAVQTVNNNDCINLNSLKSGIYWVQIEDSTRGKSAVKRIVKL